MTVQQIRLTANLKRNRLSHWRTIKTNHNQRYNTHWLLSFLVDNMAPV